MQLDNILERDVILYNQSRLRAFRKGIQFNKNDEFEKILSARYMKVSRIKKHLVWQIVSRKYLYFLTFTFDDVLLSKCQRTKRDLIKNCMLSFDDDVLYILNIDYGKKNEREHFHALLATDNSSDLICHIRKYYSCRFKVQKVDICGDDIKRLSKYINKLSNHCKKDSTYNKRIVYNFKAYDGFPPPLNRILYIKDSYNLGLC